MKDFFRKNGFGVVIGALLLTAVISIGSSIFHVNPIRDLLGILGTPFRAVSTAVYNWGHGVWSYATEYEALQAKVSELERQVAEMEQENREATRALEENERLRELLDLREKRRDFVFESATVTGRTTNSWTATLTVSKGTLHGVEEGDCVITETGALVGVIEQAGTNWATVTTIIDPDISMGALIFRNGEDGILEGDLTLMVEGWSRLSYLNADSELVSGDEVLTSGLGGVYPSGLVVGYVESLHSTPSGVEQYAVIEPAARLDELEEVFIIKEFDIVE